MRFLPRVKATVYWIVKSRCIIAEIGARVNAPFIAPWMSRSAGFHQGIKKPLRPDVITGQSLGMPLDTDDKRGPVRFHRLQYLYACPSKRC